MQKEQRSDLGKTRLAAPASHIVFVIYLLALGALAWAPSGGPKTIGGLFLGFTAALLIAPRLAIWRVADRDETATASTPFKESSNEA